MDRRRVSEIRTGTERTDLTPLDVVYTAFSEAFFKGALDLFQGDNEMKNIVLTDARVREQAIRHFFNRTLREVRENTAA